MFSQAPSFSFSSTPSSGASPAPLAKTSSTPLFGAQSGTGASGAGSLFPSQSAAGTTGIGQSGGLTPTGLGFNSSQPSPFSTTGASTGAPSPFAFAKPSFSPIGGQQSTGIVPFGGGTQVQGAGGMQQGAMILPGASQPPDDSALRELQSIQESYVSAPGNNRYKFQYLFLNVVKDPAARVKPNDVDELQWREALRRAGGAQNPDGLWPVPYHGFKGLIERKKFQTDAIKEHKERLEILQKNIAALANRHETVVHVQMENIKARHQELSKKLLTTLRHIDALEGRFSRAVGYDTSTSKELLHRLEHQIKAMESTLAANSAHGLLGRVDSLASAARVQSGTNVDTENANIDDKSLSQIFRILEDYSDAISRMQNAIHRNARDVSILHELPKQTRGTAI